jgi:hypothetical protein
MAGGERHAAGSYALIVAADRYSDPGLSRLRSPAQDARELAHVLKDPAIGGYQVQILMNQPGHVVSEEIEGFFASRLPDDLLVLYFSCHGVKDSAGSLYFAASTTKLNRLAASGISSAFVYEQVQRCRSHRIILLLDCCYSGAYLRGHRPRAGDRVSFDPIQGRGWAVITSSTALEYSFEIDSDEIGGTATPSVFTSALAEGLRTGEADRNADGFVSIDDLYAYVFDRVRERTPYQTPEKKGDIRGDLIVARNPRPLVPKPRPLPEPLAAAVESPLPGVRKAAVGELAGLIHGTDQGLAWTAHHALQTLARDDNRSVSSAAETALAHASRLPRNPVLTNGEIPADDITIQSASSAPANGYPPTSNLALSLLAYLLPLATFITLFSRDRVVRMNAVQALEIYIIYAAAAISNFFAVAPHPGMAARVTSQPWYALLITAAVCGYCLATGLLILCVVQFARLKQPKIFTLTRVAFFIAYRGSSPRSKVEVS